GKSEAGAGLVALYQRAHAQVLAGAHDADAGADAIEAAARIGHVGILPTTAGIVGNRNEYPPMRVKAIWAFGVLGSADDTQTCNALIRILRDEREIGAVQFEAAKALGAVRFKPAIEPLRAKAREGHDASLSWICHHAADRIAETTTPYLAPQLVRRPDTQITDEQHDRTDLTPAAR
ncbi:MAG TPA: HEAT repeat domain-containing protein, partial [Tepidisphaeraceae bacterium]|nr:HEAT repeat domain-containing protein [Tepidisphaeraceae bacterium]